MNSGMQTISWLYNEQLRVDNEWSEPLEHGFRWWADQNAQTIEVIGHESGPDGIDGYLISVQTELLHSLDLGDPELLSLSAMFMPSASMSGVIYCEETRRLLLASLVRVYDQISSWMNPMISLASALQIGEARMLGPGLASALGAEFSVSGPPNSSLRDTPDELADLIPNLVVPMGQQSSQWLLEDFSGLVEQYMNQPPAVLATPGEAGFTVEFPYGEMTSLCQVKADVEHPRYGSGLFLLQSFPVSYESEVDGIKLALLLNEIELSEEPFGYGFGSFVYKNDTLNFTSFFPNAMFRPGLLPNIYFTCGRRAQQISARLTGNDWS